MSRRVMAFGGARLVLKALVGCFAIGLVAATVALAASLTMGNAAVDRPNLDTFRNFIIVDQSNSADADGLLNEIRYYAKLSAARDQGAVAFAIVRGDQATGFTVVWISENIVKPASSGVRSLVPATAIPIKAGDNLAIYFEKQGLVPYTLVEETDPQLWEFWQPNNSGKPPVGGTLVLADPLGTGTTHKRNYSVQGWTTDCTFTVKRPIKADGSSVFGRRGVIPVKLKPSCGDRTLAPTIKITYTAKPPPGRTRRSRRSVLPTRARPCAGPVGTTSTTSPSRARPPANTGSASTSPASKLPRSYSRSGAALPVAEVVSAKRPASRASIALRGSCEGARHPQANPGAGRSASPFP